MEAISRFCTDANRFIYFVTNPMYALNWSMPYIYWIVVILSSLCIVYYGATKDKRPMNKVWYMIITYLFLKGVANL